MLSQLSKIEMDRVDRQVVVYMYSFSNFDIVPRILMPGPGGIRTDSIHLDLGYLLYAVLHA